MPWQLAQLATICEPRFVGQPVIAGEIGGGAGAFYAELLRKAHAFVAAGAGGLGEVLRVDRGVRIEVRLDGVNAVAIGADRGLRVAASDGLAVDALHEFGFHRRMALGAGERDVEFEDGRFLVAGAANFMNAVAVGADRSLGGSGGDGLSVHALLVGIELLGGFAARSMTSFLEWQVAQVAGMLS